MNVKNRPILIATYCAIVCIIACGQKDSNSKKFSVKMKDGGSVTINMEYVQEPTDIMGKIYYGDSGYDFIVRYQSGDPIFVLNHDGVPVLKPDIPDISNMDYRQGFHYILPTIKVIIFYDKEGNEIAQQEVGWLRIDRKDEIIVDYAVKYYNETGKVLNAFKTLKPSFHYDPSENEWIPVELFRDIHSIRLKYRTRLDDRPELRHIPLAPPSLHELNQRTRERRK